MKDWKEERIRKSKESEIKFTKPSLAVQSQKGEADINKIVRDFGVTGRPPPGSVRVPLYGDFTDTVDDYASAVYMVKAAQESFLAMPAELRKKLDNDPQKFLDWCADPDNRPEMYKLGLAVPPPEPERPPVPPPPPPEG